MKATRNKLLRRTFISAASINGSFAISRLNRRGSRTWEGIPSLSDTLKGLVAIQRLLLAARAKLWARDRDTRVSYDPDVSEAYLLDIERENLENRARWTLSNPAFRPGPIRRLKGRNYLEPRFWWGDPAAKY
jgi:hypothetical protein